MGSPVVNYGLIGGPSVDSFIGLSDTPGSYVGQAGRTLIVDAGENGLIYADPLVDPVSKLVSIAPANQAITIAGITTLTFNSELLGTFPLGNLSALGVWTCTVAGMYIITCAYTFRYSTPGVNIRDYTLNVSKNNGTGDALDRRDIDFTSTGSDLETLGGSTAMQLIVGDDIRVVVRNAAGTTPFSTSTAGTDANHLTISRVSV
jgi:hypothetical protein